MTDPATDPTPIAAQPVQEPSLASLDLIPAQAPAPDPVLLLQAQVDGLTSQLATAKADEEVKLAEAHQAWQDVTDKAVALTARVETAEQESANLRTTTADLVQRAADASALLQSGLTNTNAPMLHDLMAQALALLAE